jgi:RNA recognition motif-containing protein
MNKTLPSQPTEPETKYVDMDNDSGMWCIFGVNSGFAYRSFADKDDAEKALNA